MWNKSTSTWQYTDIYVTDGESLLGSLRKLNGRDLKYLFDLRAPFWMKFIACLVDFRLILYPSRFYFPPFFLFDSYKVSLKSLNCECFLLTFKFHHLFPHSLYHVLGVFYVTFSSDWVWKIFKLLFRYSDFFSPKVFPLWPL